MSMIESQSDSTIRSLRFYNLRTACSVVLWRTSQSGLILGHCMATPYHRDMSTRPTDWAVFCPSDGRLNLQILAQLRALEVRLSH